VTHRGLFQPRTFCDSVTYDARVRSSKHLKHWLHGAGTDRGSPSHASFPALSLPAPGAISPLSRGSQLTSPDPRPRASGSKANGGFSPQLLGRAVCGAAPRAPRDAPHRPGRPCHRPPRRTAPARREAGSASPSSNAQLRHAQQFSILSAIFCSTELVVCIELVFIFPNTIYQHNHVSDFDIAQSRVGSAAAAEQPPAGTLQTWGWILLSPTSPRNPPAPWC